MGWPWPRDSAVDRARKVAGTYRHHLHLAAPELCGQVDDTMRGYGQWWIVPHLITYDPQETITADLAADLASVSESTIRQWAITPHPDRPGRALLPRHGWDGRRRTYLVADVYEAAHLAGRDTRR